ncbi:hypothetical protein CEXT_156101 [Caerostris extrusa]|uniref:Uncharacterized protein n=1 Tax=Caerostris extrusa TaxID=172846 RepID=A0AAV4QCS4_CAEEX|nr:hypothetical protein CEXT_156101 [Caerostris extrusa]
MSARRMQATSHDSVSRRVSRITTIIHGMVRQKLACSERAGELTACQPASTVNPARGIRGRPWQTMKQPLGAASRLRLMGERAGASPRGQHEAASGGGILDYASSRTDPTGKNASCFHS